MARPGLLSHRKFLRLARLLNSKALALGTLELMWFPAFESGDDFLGDDEDVAARCEYPGPPRDIVGPLADSEFIEQRADRVGWFIHDLWDHAPEYAQRRAKKEIERANRGTTTRELLSAAGKKRAESAIRKGGKFLSAASLQPAFGQPQAGTPAPAPAPAPSLEAMSSSRSTSQPLLLAADVASKADRSVGEVFEYWRTRLKHPRAILDAKRERAVKARLAEGRTVAELKQAIDGCAKTPHNMGANNSHQRYDDLELICRSAGQVERFMANASGSSRSNRDEIDFNPTPENRG